jgi:DedD protein
MARPISDEELQLKKRARRRLVGAIVLVTAVAVILPMVLDSEPRPPSQNVDIQIPATDGGEFKPKGAALPQGTEAKTASAAPQSRTESPASTPTPASPIADPAAPPKRPAAAPDATKEPEKSAAKEATGKDPSSPKDVKKSPAASVYVVQVAALADPAKAKQLEKRMAGTGVKTYTEVVSTQSGQVTRVRAGPYPTREAAEKARTQLKKAGLDGQVVAK